MIYIPFGEECLTSMIIDNKFKMVGKAKGGKGK